jgi:hypothetical protein
MKVFLALYMSVLTTLSCNRPAVGKKDQGQDSAVRAADTTGIIKVQSKWKYTDADDEIHSGNKTHFANLLSKDALFLKSQHAKVFPSLELFPEKGKTYILLNIERGQFNSSTDSLSIGVTFDNEKTERYYARFPITTNGDKSSIIIVNYEKFLPKLKKSSTVIISAEIYDNGTKMIEFETAGLVWNY